MDEDEDASAGAKEPQMTVEEYEEYRREVEQRRRRPFWMRDEDDDAAGRYRFKQNRPNPPLPPPPPPPKAEASGALDGNNDGFIDMGELRRAQTSAGERRARWQQRRLHRHGRVAQGTDERG